MTDLFAARWTDRIHAEWIDNLVVRRPELSRVKLERTRDLMDQAIPDSLITHYEPLIDGLDLPDAYDRHVLAAAIRAGSQVIVTFNLKDFPTATLEPLGIEALHPDEFVTHQMELHEGTVVSAAKAQRATLKKPPVSADQLLQTLASQGLVVTADRLREFEDLI